MHSQRTMVAIAAAAGIASAFMPWVSMGMLSVSGTDGSDGWIVIGIFSVALIMALAGAKDAPMRGGGRGAVITMGILGAALGGWKLSDVSSVNVSDNPFARGISAGAGLYLMLVAGIALVVVSAKKHGAAS
jgi:hypothetical protein